MPFERARSYPSYGTSRPQGKNRFNSNETQNSGSSYNMTANIPIKKNNSSSAHYDTLQLALQQEEEEVKSSSAAALLFEHNHECHTNTTRPSFEINHVRVQSIDPNAQRHLKKIPTRKRNGEEQGCFNDNDRQQVKKQYREPLLQEPHQDEFHNDSETHPVNYQDHDEEVRKKCISWHD